MPEWPFRPMDRMQSGCARMDELAQLTEYCRKLGAPAGQAETMAGQLLKRASQLAVERNQSREQAMAYLLRLVAQGSTGEVPREFQPPDNRPKT
jgi:hypothetical protein